MRTLLRGAEGEGRTHEHRRLDRAFGELRVVAVAHHQCVGRELVGAHKALVIGLLFHGRSPEDLERVDFPLTKLRCDMRKDAPNSTPELTSAAKITKNERHGAKYCQSRPGRPGSQDPRRAAGELPPHSSRTVRACRTVAVALPAPLAAAGGGWLYHRLHRAGRCPQARP